MTIFEKNVPHQSSTGNNMFQLVFTLAAHAADRVRRDPRRIEHRDLENKVTHILSLTLTPQVTWPHSVESAEL